jgi:nucleotide-binding universal stress UspA family protein
MLLDRIVLPVASPDDAIATARALRSHLDGTDEVVAVHVIEKAGGAPDKASVEQREQEATEIFAALRGQLPNAESEVRYGTDVAEAIVRAASDNDATAIVFTPRGGSRWMRLLTGDVSLSLITQTDRPVIALPDVEGEDTA